MARRRTTLRVVAASAALVAASVLTGCATPQSTFDAAIGQGIAAVETARLAVDQQLDDRTFTTAATTTLGDARRELVDASATVSEADVTTPTDAAFRTELLGTLAAAIDAVNGAREAISGIGDLSDTVAPLEDAAAALEALEQLEGDAG